MHISFDAWVSPTLTRAAPLLEYEQLYVSDSRVHGEKLGASQPLRRDIAS